MSPRTGAPVPLVSRFAPPSEEAEAALSDALALLMAALPPPAIASAPPTRPYVLVEEGLNVSLEGNRRARETGTDGGTNP